jgi:hypothetical protein
MTEAAVSAIRGAVDNVGKEKIYGWAWHPDRPAERMRVEARLGSRTVLATLADLARGDLPGAGVGDGSHAFELKLTAECVARRNELFIVAVASDGSEATLPFRVPRTPPDKAAEVKREADLLAAAKTVLRQELRAALPPPARATELEAAAKALTAAQARLEERLGTLEVWLTRLDARLAAMAEPKPEPRRVDGWQVALGGILLVTAAAGVGVALLVLGPGLPGAEALRGALGAAGWSF